MTPIDSHTPQTGAPRCPICAKPVEVAFKPFCSGRCADVDLGRWLTGGYAIPGGDVDADEDGDEAAHRPTGDHTHPDEDAS